MPLIEATIGVGRTPEEVRRLIHELHEATVRAIDANPEAVRIVIREIPWEHWAAGDVTAAERRSVAAPSDT